MVKKCISEPMRNLKSRKRSFILLPINFRGVFFVLTSEYSEIKIYILVTANKFSIRKKQLFNCTSKHRAYPQSSNEKNEGIPRLHIYFI
jgi:hypothetical protein